MIAGIDLGTTNSLAAVWRDGEPRLVPNALGEFLTPSIVAADDNGEILIGRPAAERMMTSASVVVTGSRGSRRLLADS
jgi:molecular chaperone HscC